ncbi:MAG: twin transmembrane helix small protein [Pseudomonadota bacterium]
MKFIVILMLLAIIYSLGSGLYYLNKDNRSSPQLAKALTWRIALSVALFLFLIVGAWQGWISPNQVQF